MAAKIKFKRGSGDPSLTYGEPGFDNTNKKFFIGSSSDASIWVGAEIKPTATVSWSSDSTIPTALAVSDKFIADDRDGTIAGNLTISNAGGSNKSLSFATVDGSNGDREIIKAGSGLSSGKFEIFAGSLNGSTSTVTLGTSAKNVCVGYDASSNGWDTTENATWTYQFGNVQSYASGTVVNVAIASAMGALPPGVTLVPVTKNITIGSANQNGTTNVDLGSSSGGTINVRLGKYSSGAGTLNAFIGIDNASVTNNISSFGTFTHSRGSFNLAAENQLRFQDASGGEYVAFKAPATVGTSSIYTLPGSVGSAGQVLKIQSISGNDATLHWAADTGSTVTVDENNEVAGTYYPVFTSNTGTSGLTLEGDKPVSGAGGLTYRPLGNILGVTSDSAATTGTYLSPGGISAEGTSSNRSVFNDVTGTVTMGISSASVEILNTAPATSTTNTIRLGGNWSPNASASQTIYIGTDNAVNAGTSINIGTNNNSSTNNIAIGTLEKGTTSIYNPLRFYEQVTGGTNYIQVEAQSMSSNYTLKLPASVSTNRYLKVTNVTSGVATLSWEEVSATATSVSVADNADNNERNILFTDATAAGAADVKIDVTGGDADVGIQYNPSLNRLSTGSYRLQSGSSSNWLSLAANGSQTGSYTFTLPVDGGTADYVLKTNGSGGTSWTNTIAQTNTVKVVESVDNDSTILRMVGVASSTTDQYQEMRMDSDGLEYRPKINRFTIKGDTGGDLGWNTGGTSIGSSGGKTGGGATQGGSWGVGQLEFMSVDGTAGNPAGATRFAVNAAQTDFVTYVLPEAAGSQGQVLRISTSTSTTDSAGDPVYYLEWGAGATADLATDVAGGAAGDLLYQQGNNDTAFLTIGASGTVLTSSGSAPQWTASSGTGNIARVDGATFGTGSTWNGSAIGAVYGGTGQSTYATGDILYASATNTLSKLTKPSNTSVLQMTSSGVPSWVDTLSVAEGGTGTTTGSITGAGALTFTSGSGTAVTLTSTVGGNSNINLTPTGTGTVAIGGSGRITGLADLTSSSPGSDAANKNYVDSVAQGLHVHASVRLATTGALTNSPNYSNATATLTATTNGALSIDGVAVALNDRVLVKNQSSALQNGIYDVTATGGASATYTLTRATDFDSAAEIDGGDFLFVTAGNTLASTGWVQTTSGVVVGTDNIVFVQFSGAGTYSASNGVRLSGTTFGLQGAGSNFLTLTTNGAIYATSSTELASGTLPLNAGGTGKALTATNGGIVWSDADSLEITSAGTSGQILVSAGAAAPVWTTASDITTGKADTVKQTLTTAAATYYLTFTDNNTNDVYENIRVNSNLTYNPNQASYSLGSTSVSNVAVMTVGSSGTGYLDAIVDGGTY